MVLLATSLLALAHGVGRPLARELNVESGIFQNRTLNRISLSGHVLSCETSKS